MPLLMDHEAHTVPFKPTAFGKYILLERIGKGGMAEVFLSRPRQQRRLVAIKVILSSLAEDKKYLEMFTREGMLAVQLNHDAIVKTYEIGTVHGTHFICMEHISGIDLSFLLRRCRSTPGLRVPVPHALYMAQRICDGLHYAHELRDPAGVLLNVVNRDVSPSNVRISFEGDIKLLDFGIAKATSGLTSEIGVLKGKFAYMSPEQVRGLPIDRRSDVFSLGIVLHEMLIQEKLFRGDSDFQLMDLVRRAEIKPPSASNPRVPPEVDRIVVRALRRDPAERYGSAEEMSSDLRGALVPYGFNKSELRDLVRDVCNKEWIAEQELIESCLSREAPAPQAGQADEDYGEFLEVEGIEKRSGAVTSQPAGKERRVPLWMWLLLSLAVLLLVTATVLLVVL